ncbi:DNA mismatch repair protein [Mucilaginibacter sp. UC70_90]
MSFIVDKQTLEDLNLLGKYTPNSVFNLFNKAQTGGGERLLQQMFQKPLTDPLAINKRSELLRFFENKGLAFPFDRQEFREVENYLGTAGKRSYAGALLDILSKKVQGLLMRDERYADLHRGLTATIKMLNALCEFLGKLKEQATFPFEEELNSLTSIVADPRIQNLLQQADITAVSVVKIASYDYLLKQLLRNEMETLLGNIYKLDVNIAVSRVGKDHGFAYAQALPKSDNLINISALWHPALPNGVANPLNFDKNTNMIFLTGANMAGKSTLMKSFGIAVYLAHMGFPVAAKNMQFSVCDGIYSSINVPDSLNMGYSHFYAEVLRVKKVAEEVATGNSFIVLFDELFKGTNVKGRL